MRVPINVTEEPGFDALVKGAGWWYLEIFSKRFASYLEDTGNAPVETDLDYVLVSRKRTGFVTMNSTVQEVARGGRSFFLQLSWWPQKDLLIHVAYQGDRSRKWEISGPSSYNPKRMAEYALFKWIVPDLSK